MNELGKLLCMGIRGALPGDPLLESDLDACRAAGVGSVILFDVDVPSKRKLEAEGGDELEASLAATRNILDEDQLRTLVVHIRGRLGLETFIGIDQEGGQVARLSPRRGFDPDPAAVEFAVMPLEERVEAAGLQAMRLARLGIDLNFAPCVDLALEERNEVILGNGRSYGHAPDAVIEMATTILDAHLQAGVASCIKHFPGHGSSLDDTHLGAVDITDTWHREEELQPYREFCGRSGMAVMAAHVLHRKLDATHPASLSSAIIGGLLREELGFEGVVVTDSIDMRAISDHFSAGQAAVAAIVAGADLVIDGFNLHTREQHPATEIVAALQRALDEGAIPGGQSRIEESLKRLRTLRAEIGARR